MTDFKADEIKKIIGDSSFISIGFSDMDGILRGKEVRASKFISSLQEGVRFCNVAFGWDMHDDPYTNHDFATSGYADATLSLDPNIIRIQQWRDNQPYVTGDFSSDEKLKEICPRSILKKVASKAIQMGFQPVFSQEFEWFNFQKTGHDSNSLSTISDGMFGYSLLRLSQHKALYDDIKSHMELLKIPIEGIHTETGPGAAEAAIQKAEIIEAADRAFLFKNMVKQIAANHGVMTGFMAKWNERLPGCGGHVHQSLLDSEGNNVFFNTDKPNDMSDIMRYFLAGQQYCLPFIMPLFAPVINSYKRYLGGAWSPAFNDFGFENRLAALRVITGSPYYTRIENRVPGADTNPYLVMAASLASGLFGIENKLQPKDSKQPLPMSLLDAVDFMTTNNIASELLGSTFVDHFLSTRVSEIKKFNKSVTDWELKRYMEVI